MNRLEFKGIINALDLDGIIWKTDTNIVWNNVSFSLEPHGIRIKGSSDCLAAFIDFLIARKISIKVENSDAIYNKEIEEIRKNVEAKNEELRQLNLAKRDALKKPTTLIDEEIQRITDELGNVSLDVDNARKRLLTRLKEAGTSPTYMAEWCDRKDFTTMLIGYRAFITKKAISNEEYKTAQENARLGVIRSAMPNKAPRNFSLYNCSGIVSSGSPMCVKLSKSLDKFEDGLNELMYKSIMKTPEQVYFQVESRGNSSEKKVNFTLRGREWHATVIRDINKFVLEFSGYRNIGCKNESVINVRHSFSMNEGEKILYSDDKTGMCFKPAGHIMTTGTMGFNYDGEWSIARDITRGHADEQQFNELLKGVNSTTQYMKRKIKKIDLETETK